MKPACIVDSATGRDICINIAGRTVRHATIADDSLFISFVPEGDTGHDRYDRLCVCLFARDVFDYSTATGVISDGVLHIFVPYKSANEPEVFTIPITER